MPDKEIALSIFAYCFLFSPLCFYLTSSKLKCLIIIPHQDDEIHLAGNLIASLKDTRNIYVAYTTSGDYAYNASVRYKEAIKSLWKLGKIKKVNNMKAYFDQNL